MANEFKVKNGLIIDQGGANITGSVLVSGSVGVGTPNPLAKLHVSGATGIALQLDRTGGNSSVYGLNSLIFETDAAFRFGQYAARDFYINNQNGPSGTVFISSAGSLGIGTVTPGQKIDVVGSGQFSSQVLVGANTAATTEATLVLGAPPAGGAGEGGQIAFQPASGYTSGAFVDNWQNQLRVLRGTSTTTDAVIASYNLQSKQVQFPAYNGASAFTGTAVANLAVDSNGNILTVSTSGGSVFPYTGNAVITGSLTTTGIIYAQPNGGMYFQGGDDAALYDINVVNTMGIYGVQDSTIGSIKLGSGGGIISGKSGRIGIGTTNPTNGTLEVNGNVYATSFTGSLSGTASFASNADLLDGQHGSYYYPASNPNGYTTNTGTVVSVATSGTVSGITLTGGTITTSGTITLGGSISGLTNTNLSGTAGITNANLANSAITIAGTSTSLGGSISQATILAGSGVWSGSAQLPSGVVSGSSQINGASITNNGIIIGTTSITLGSSATTITGLTSVTSTTFVGSLTGTASGNLTSASTLTAGNLSGTIPSGVLGNSTLYVGTTAVALNRGSANQALTGISSITLPGSTSGTAILQATATAGTPTLSLPTSTGTLIGTGDTSTVTNTMLAGSIANAKLANSSITIGTTAIALGASATTITGLSSVTSTTFVGSLTGNASTATSATSATNATYVVSQDTRAVASTPETNNASQGVRFDFKQNSTNGLSDGGTYNGVLYFRKYGSGTDWTGGGAHEIGFSDNGNLHHRYGTSTTWGSWYKLLDSNNYNSYSPTLSGTGATGTWGISISGNAATATTASFASNADLLDGQHGSYYYPTSNPAGFTSNTGTVISVGGTGTVNGITLSGTVTTSGNLTLGGTLSGIGNSQLTNSSITIGSSTLALGSSTTTLAGLSSVAATNLTASVVSASGAITAGGLMTVGSTLSVASNTVLFGALKLAGIPNASKPHILVYDTASAQVSYVTASVFGGGGGSGTVNTGTAGYLAYYPSTGTTVDDSGLYWDSANVRIGIGTSTPQHDVNLYGGNKWLIATSPNVQRTYTIGRGTDAVTLGGTPANITSKITFTPNSYWSGVGYFADDITFNVSSPVLMPSSTDSTFEVMRITADGLVGINTTTPQHTLDVNGSIGTTAGVYDTSGNNLGGLEFNHTRGWIGSTDIGTVSYGVADGMASFTDVPGAYNNWAENFNGQVLGRCTSGDNISKGQFVILQNNGLWVKANADGANPYTAINLLGIALDDAGPYQAFAVLLDGLITTTYHKEVGNPAKDGAPIYMGYSGNGTTGMVSETPPAATGEIVRLVGHNIIDQGSGRVLIRFQPDNTWIVL